MAHFGNLIVTAPDGRQETVGLDRPRLTFGRERNNDLHLDDVNVSRHHGRFECDDEGCVVVDLDSVNGIQVDGKAVKEAPLKGNEIIQVGRYQLFYISPTTPVLAAPPPSEADPRAAEPSEATLVQSVPSKPPSRQTGRGSTGGVVFFAVLALVLIVIIGLYLFGETIGIGIP